MDTEAPKLSYDPPLPGEQKHIAIGYRPRQIAAAHHFESALRRLGHRVTFVGIPYGDRKGFDGSLPVNDLVSDLPHMPDLYLWIDSAGRYFPPGIEGLPMPTACYLIDVHLGTWRHQVARFFDSVFVAQKDYLAVFRQAVGHHQVHWLPLAASLPIHRNQDLPRIYEVGFVGHVSTRPHRQTPRQRRLRLIADRFCTNDFFRFYPPTQVGQVYSQSKIVFNTSIAGDVNMRVFEGAACGALVLTDSIDNGLGEIFEIGTEIATYSSDSHMLEQLQYYLDHDRERERIAQAGHRRAVADHSYAKRAVSLLDRVFAPSFERLAPLRSATESDRWKARRIVLTHLHALDAMLDEARSAGFGPLRRFWTIIPCLARRLLI